MGQKWDGEALTCDCVDHDHDKTSHVGGRRDDIDPLPHNRLVIAWPFYDTLQAAWFMRWTKMDKDHVVGQVATQAVYLPDAMGQLSEMAFKHIGRGWDYLVIYEHDMLPPMDSLNRMARYNPDKHDVVASLYFRHDPPHHAMTYMHVEPPQYNPLSPRTIKSMVENPGLYEVDGVPMGFTAIHRKVFENWDYSVPMWESRVDELGPWSHDLHFSLNAKRQGISLWIDSGIVCDHMTEVPVGYADSQRCLAESAPPTWADGAEPMWAAEGWR